MKRPWVYDITTEHAALITTGGRVWNAARRLCSFLEEVGPDLGLSRPGLRVLELGAGLGWLGMTLARNLPAAEVVVLTEQEEGGGLDWLKHNLALNTHLAGMQGVRAEPCDWRQYHDQTQPQLQQQQQQQQLDEGPDCPGWQHVPAAVSTDNLQRPLQDQDQHQGKQGTDQQSTVRAGVAAQETWFENVATGSGGSDGREPGGNGVGAGGASTGGATSRDEAGSGSGGSGGCGGTGSGGGGCCLQGQRWDLILGSDLVYNSVGAECLPRVMRALAGPDTRILYCHTKHRFDTHDMQFFSELVACGLDCREVREPNVLTPPPSPPPLAELFPEMRIAVYDIRLAAAAVPTTVAVPAELETN